MRPFLALGTVALGVLALAGAAVSSTTAQSSRCLSTPVHGKWVRAGHFKGGIDTDYDVVNGRFRLQVGGYRDRATGLTQKIPWFIATKYPVGRVLTVRGERIGAHKRRFTQRFPQAGYMRSLNAGQYVFPSIIAPPAEGCWNMTFRSRHVVGRLRVWVHGHG